jgi:hypothetical protein
MSMGRVEFGSDHIILLFILIQFKPDLFKFESKNLNLYPTQRVTGRPDTINLK